MKLYIYIIVDRAIAFVIKYTFHYGYDFTNCGSLCYKIIKNTYITWTLSVILLRVSYITSAIFTYNIVCIFVCNAGSSITHFIFITILFHISFDGS